MILIFYRRESVWDLRAEERPAGLKTAMGMKEGIIPFHLNRERALF